MTNGKLHIVHRRHPKMVRVLYGAPEMLVNQRNLVNKYETNQAIKYLSTWFLLKSLTTSSYIQGWHAQQKYIFSFLQMGVRTFKKHLTWLQQQKLIYIDAQEEDSFRLVSYEEAAHVLGIEYTGTFQVSFNPKKIKNGKQAFQYLLRTEECEFHKQRQVTAIMDKLDKNPAFKQDIIYHIGQLGADYQRLMVDEIYFVKRLLALQARLFCEGSALLDYIMQYRADINRGVICIKRHHGYRSKQSVSYMKRKMAGFGFAKIEKKAMESKHRSRIYVPPNEETHASKIRKDGLVEGYIYNPVNKSTIWRLCDQISRTYEHRHNHYYQKTNAYAA